MDYELRIVIEKVAVRSQEVIKRDTITSYALQRPTSIIELGLRHAEQISLLEKVQNILAQFIAATRGRKVDCLASCTDQTCCSISSILRGCAER